MIDRPFIFMSHYKHAVLDMDFWVAPPAAARSAPLVIVFTPQIYDIRRSLI